MDYTKWLCASVVSVVASTAYGEITPLSTEEMSNTTGQAGLTIDINKFNLDIGAIDYQDQGYLSIRGVQLDSEYFDGTGIDNVRMTVDVVGAVNDLGVSSLGAQYLADKGASLSLREWDQNSELTDGDLVVSFRPQDDSLGAQSIDYGLAIQEIALVDSGYSSTGTVLVQDTFLSGYLGLMDIIIDNGSQGMNINAYFNAFGSLEMPFIAAATDLSIHNGRGSDFVIMGSSYADTFAHAQINIRRHDYAGGGSALAFDLIDFAADVDLTNIHLGNGGQSIGDVYLTDVSLAASTIVYGH